MGTKEKSPKQGISRAKDLTVKLHEDRDSTYHRLDYCKDFCSGCQII